MNVFDHTRNINELYRNISSNYSGEIILNDHYDEKVNIETLNGLVDIYLPEIKLGVIYVDYYYNRYKEDSYNLSKTVICENNGITVIQVFEEYMRSYYGAHYDRKYMHAIILQHLKSDIIGNAYRERLDLYTYTSKTNKKKTTIWINGIEGGPVVRLICNQYKNTMTVKIDYVYKVFNLHDLILFINKHIVSKYDKVKLNLDRRYWSVLDFNEFDEIYLSKIKKPKKYGLTVDSYGNNYILAKYSKHYVNHICDCGELVYEFKGVNDSVDIGSES